MAQPLWRMLAVDGRTHQRSDESVTQLLANEPIFVSRSKPRLTHR